MPLNFNIRPYNDDYDETKHFYRVLFRPSVAVQARELTQAQSILQQQVKYLGDSIYKHGSMVIPGQISTDPKTAYVRLKPTYGFLGPTAIPVNLALFKNQTVKGLTTGLKALVVHSVAAENTDSPTLYVKYLNTGISGETVFAVNEVLTLENSTTGLAEVESANATGLAISAQIDQGVYYIWGYFVRVEKQYLLLNKYTNIVSTRVGLAIKESIVTPEDDITLTDNAQNSTNYAAPGAHRYKIDLVLTQKAINATDDENFVELVRLLNSITQSKVVNDTYSILAKELANRMDDTNGDFAIRNFQLDVREHLDTAFVTSGVATGSSVYVDDTPGPEAPATLKLANTASAVNGFYNGMEIYLSNGTGAGQVFYVTGYTGSTKTAILDRDYLPNKVADTTTTYTISDPTKVNRGVYSPAPFGVGDETKLAVGLESGRAYVDGYKIDTLTTTFVDMDKARDSTQAVNAQVSTPIGNYILVKNVRNIPLSAATAPNDFLVINFSNIKSNSSGTFDLATEGIGTARVHTIEFYQGTNAAATDAVFKFYLFDVAMNPGQNINNAKAFNLINDVSHNNNGNGLGSWGDICTMFDAANVNGTGLVPGVTITGPSGQGTEVLVSYDAINNIIITEPTAGSGVRQILNSGTFTAPSSTTGTISARRQIFNAAFATLVYPTPTSLIKTVRDSGNTTRTSFYVREMFEATRNGSGQYIFTTTGSAPFAPFNVQDYAAVVVTPATGRPSSDIGKFIDLSQHTFTFSGNPANTTLTFTITGDRLGGSPSTPGGGTIKMMATLFKIASGEKAKALTDASLAFANPKAIMSLEKADVYNIVKVIDSGNPGVDADENDPTHLDIKSQYLLDNGQRDYYYDVGRVLLSPGAPGPTGRIKVLFKYFAHSGSGDYFSVDSYTNQVEYKNIPTYITSDGRFLPLRDSLDFRPRKEDLNFSFAGTGGSYSAPLKPNNIILADYQYYLGRIDKVYVDQYGNFNVLRGTPAINPQAPPDPLDGMMLYTIKLNPYTLSAKDLSFKGTKNPRYTMHDIGKLEDRIANLEYYTNLSQLEQKTATFSITDTKTGLDRFKNGFVVDNFSGHAIGNVFDPTYRCSVDPTLGIMRPTFTQTNNTLIFNENASTHYADRCSIAILPYEQNISIEQTFATTVVNINPFAVFTYSGEISLIPPTDTWKDTVQRPAINLTDNTAMDGYQYLNDWSGSTWGDWQTSWVGQPVSETTSTTRVQSETVTNSGGASVNPQDVIANIIRTDPDHWIWDGNGGGIDIIHINGAAWATAPEWAGQQATLVEVQVQGAATTQTTSTTTFTDTTVSTSQQIGQTRTGTQTRVTAQLTQRINNQLVDTSLTPYIRSRRIKIVGRHFKPGCRLYPFFDNVYVSGFCRPYQDPDLTPSITGAAWTQMDITWGGDFNPQSNMNQGTTADTGDTGRTENYLVGGLNDPIYADGLGTVTLFFEIPCTPVNRFRVGARPFRLTTSPKNGNGAEAYGDANYNASGLIDQYQETITSISTPKIETRQVGDSRVITQNLGSTTTTSQQTTSTTTNPIDDDSEAWTPILGFQPIPESVFLHLWTDPLSQSFLVKEKGGMYLTKIEVFFQTRDEEVPVTIQVRSMVNGYPSQIVIPYSEKTLYPNNPVLSSTTAAGTINPDGYPTGDLVIHTSDDASVPTQFIFDSPIYLNDGTEYCFVLISNSIKYNVYTAQLGGTIVGSTNIVNTPPYLGSLFKSQNASTWVADPTQNMKFKIYKAKFDPLVNGEMYFTSSAVQPDTLTSLPFQTVVGSNLIRVFHKNHQMPKGQFVNSQVKISGVPTGTYNGITASQLNGTFSIDNVDLDSYTITVSGTAAAGTGRTGPDGVVVTRNVQYDSATIIANTLTPTGTGVKWFIKTLSGKSPNNNSQTVQEPYNKDTQWNPIEVNKVLDFTTPRMIASDVNETTSVIGATAYDRKSFVLKAVLSTEQDNLTPQLDMTRMSIATANTRLDDPTFANYTIEALDKGVTLTSGSNPPSNTDPTLNNALNFDSNVILNVVAVTGGQYALNDTVLGSRSGAQGTVVAWNGLHLTLKDVTGVFQVTEPASNGSTVVGTIQGIEYINTIINPSGSMDFSAFIPGYYMTIVGSPSNSYPFSNPVVLLAVNGNQLTVDTNGAPFVTAINQANVQLTMYNRFVAETGPSRCTTGARYITRQFNLANPANSLHVLFTINRPPGSFVDCYYRTLRTNETQPFETVLWKKIELDATVDADPSTNPDDFKEYVYNADNIGSFTAFAIKLVMRGGNSAQPPKVRDFRGIALAI